MIEPCYARAAGTGPSRSGVRLLQGGKGGETGTRSWVSGCPSLACRGKLDKVSGVDPTWVNQSCTRNAATGWSSCWMDQAGWECEWVSSCGGRVIEAARIWLLTDGPIDRGIPNKYLSRPVHCVGRWQSRAVRMTAGPSEPRWELSDGARHLICRPGDLGPSRLRSSGYEVRLKGEKLLFPDPSRRTPRAEIWASIRSVDRRLTGVAAAGYCVRRGDAVRRTLRTRTVRKLLLRGYQVQGGLS